MKVLVTGHAGYIGAVLVPILHAEDHEVIGLDSMLFDGCDLLDVELPDRLITRDLRDVDVADLVDCDAIVHLGALSNDPLGDLNPGVTYEINRDASIRLAELARSAGIERFVFASSCSLYGAGVGDELLDEDAAFNPVTPYGESKIQVEQALNELANDDFSPTYMRNATAYGVSPRQRLDIVVNNLTAWATVTGQVRLQSDGTPWRPLVHVRDICEAVRAVLAAPRELIHNEAFNVGRTEENYQIRDVATIVGEVVAGSEVTIADGAGADIRDYRVTFDKIAKTVPGFSPQWTVRSGAEELHKTFVEVGLREEHLDGPSYIRLRRLTELIDAGRLSTDVRWLS
jgi:nucleoside-diphosphate-sugar epimerase